MRAALLGPRQLRRAQSSGPAATGLRSCQRGEERPGDAAPPVPGAAGRHGVRMSRGPPGWCRGWGWERPPAELWALLDAHGGEGSHWRGCASSSNPAAVGAVHQPGEGRAVRSERGAPRSAEVYLRRSHIGILEEPSRLPVPHRENLSRVIRRCSVLKTSALNSVR